MERRISADKAFVSPFKVSNFSGFIGFAGIVLAIGGLLHLIQRFFEEFAGVGIINSVLAPVSGMGSLIPGHTVVQSFINTVTAEPVTALVLLASLVGSLLVTAVVVRFIIAQQRDLGYSVSTVVPSITALVHYFGAFVVMSLVGYGVVMVATKVQVIAPFITLIELFVSASYLIAIFGVLDQGMNALQAVLFGASTVLSNLASFVLLLGGLEILKEVQGILVSPFASFGSATIMVLSIAMLIGVLYVRLTAYVNSYVQATE